MLMFVYWFYSNLSLTNTFPLKRDMGWVITCIKNNSMISKGCENPKEVALICDIHTRVPYGILEINPIFG